MKTLKAQPRLVEQVHQAILSEIAEGRLPPGSRVIQEQIAQELGVSRQPVQQALALLRKQAVLCDAPGRGLQVAELDLEHVRNLYDLRAVIEGLAFRKAAERSGAAAAARGQELLRAGRKAVASGSVRAMIEADMAFHELIYALSGNPLVVPGMQAHWANTQRVMGEVLMRDDKPRDIWNEHEALLQAVIDGNGERAEMLARRHIDAAADFMIESLKARDRAL